MTWYKTPPTGRKFALCFYENDPRGQFYYVGQWDPKFGWYLGETLSWLEHDSVLWTHLSPPPDGVKLSPSVWLTKKVREKDGS